MISLITGSLRNKLLLVTGAGTTLLLAAALFGLMQAGGALTQMNDELISKKVANERQVRELSLDFQEQVQAWKNVLIRGYVREDREKYWAEFEAKEAEVQQRAEDLAAGVDDPALKKGLNQFVRGHRAAGDNYRDAMRTFVQTSFDGTTADRVVRGIDRPLKETLGALSDALAEEVNQTSAQLVDKRDAVFLSSAIAIAVAVVLAFIAFMLLLHRNVSVPVSHLVEDLERLAGGNFRDPVRKSTDDEIGAVAASAEKLRRDLGDLLGRVNKAVDHVGRAVGDVANAADKVSGGMERQQSETEQVATAMNEMSATVQEVSRHASDAAHSAGEADESANNGSKVVARTVQAINSVAGAVEEAAEAIADLDKESGNIGEVLDVIRGVAEQTNLLALNAAIEAARAGEQGRGFAVVADEVRSLAQRVAQSTQEIQDMIERIQDGTKRTVGIMENSQLKVGEAVTAAQEAGQALTVITQAVSRISDMNTHIAAAAEQQSATAEEINRNITHISSIAGESAQGSRDNRQRSEELRRMADELKQTISRFRT